MLDRATPDVSKMKPGVKDRDNDSSLRLLASNILSLNVVEVLSTMIYWLALRGPFVVLNFAICANCSLLMLTALLNFTMMYI